MLNTRRIKKRIRRRWQQRAHYSDTRTVFDAAEARHLIEQGWKLVEHVTVTRWAGGYHSESTSYRMGLLRPQPGSVA